jgi:uncharacterized delta-60 repeat protein
MKFKLLLLLLVFAKGFSQNVILDNTFGVNGKVTTAMGVLSRIKSMEIQPDGKIIACGITSVNGIFKLALIKYNSDGSLDTSFGTNGTVINSQFNDSFWTKISTQTDGKIIVVGQVQFITSMANKAAMLRYNPDGTLDTTFGINGFVTVNNYGGLSTLVTDLIILTDNKILLAGGANDENVQVLRYNSDGTIDSTFGLNGIFNLNLGYHFNSLNPSKETTMSIVLQSSGKIIVGGHTDKDNVSYNWDFFILRLNSDGSFDDSFGVNGFTTTNIAQGDYSTSMSIFNDDSIFVSGMSLGLLANDPKKIILVKYTSSGILDTSFGSSGKVITQTVNSNMHDICWDTKIQTDGKIVCVGQNGTGFNIFGGTSQPSEMLLLRYNTDGSLDTSFSPTGYVTASFDFNILNNGEAVAIQNDGKIIIGGSSNTLIALARYTFDNLATNSFSDNENFKIAPNPTRDFLTISVNENLKIDEVSVIDCTGKIVYNQKTNSNQINVSSLQNGIYFVKIVANDRVFQKKFIKE